MCRAAQEDDIADCGAAGCCVVPTCQEVVSQVFGSDGQAHSSRQQEA